MLKRLYQYSFCDRETKSGRLESWEGYVHRTAVKTSFWVRPRSVSLRMTGYLPVLVGSMRPFKAPPLGAAFSLWLGRRADILYASSVCRRRNRGREVMGEFGRKTKGCRSYWRVGRWVLVRYGVRSGSGLGGSLPSAKVACEV